MFQLSRQIEEENQKLIKQYINFFIKNKEKLQLDIDAERKKEEEKQKKELPTIVAQKENKELKKLLDIQKEYEQAFIASEEINKFEEEMNYNTYKTELIIQKANELSTNENPYTTVKVKNNKQDYCSYSIIGIIILAIVRFVIYIIFHKS